MTIRFVVLAFAGYVAAVLLLCLALFAGTPLAHAADTVPATVSVAPWWLWLVVPAVIAVLFLLGLLLHVAAKLCAEKLNASRAARLLELLSSLAEGAAGTLIAQPPAPAASIAAVRNGLVAAGVAYARQKMPDTIKAVGIDDPTLAARLDRAISGKLLGAGATADGSAVADAAPAPTATIPIVVTPEVALATAALRREIGPDGPGRNAG